MKRMKWLCLLWAALLAPGVARAQIGPIFDQTSKFPSDLQSPLGPQSPDPVKKFTSIACYDLSTGHLGNCSFDMTILGVHPSPFDPQNNGGHTHVPTVPVGEIQITFPADSAKGTFQSGETRFDVAVITHYIENVSAKVDTLLNLRVPPGYHTVSPQPCDATFTSWCFQTTIDVGVPGLESLPDGSPFYEKHRNGAPDHFDSSSYFGTSTTNANLTEIARLYSELTNLTLSINDMSLLKGGLFDIDSDYLTPHTWHRIGKSADINKPTGQDCRTADELRRVVQQVMPADTGFFARRSLPSQGRFLCETGNNNNIHIDFDGIRSPTPIK